MKARSPRTKKTTPDCVVPQALSLTLPPVMTIETIEALAAEYAQLPLAGHTSLTLDASRVETITTPGIQLVVALAKALQARGGNLALHTPRESFVHAFRDVGLQGLLHSSS